MKKDIELISTIIPGVRQKKINTQKDDDFFILYALPSLDPNRIENGCIDCKSAKYGNFKCGTLHTFVEDRDITDTFLNYGVGYEISDKDSICHNFFIGDGWSDSDLNDRIKQSISSFKADEKYKKIDYKCGSHKTTMYVFNPNYTGKNKIQKKENVNNIAVGEMNNKIQKRIKCVKQLLDKNKNDIKKEENVDISLEINDNLNKNSFYSHPGDQSDTSFDSENYSLDDGCIKSEITVLAKNKNSPKVPLFAINKRNGGVKCFLNEINFLQEDQANGKLKLKRICVYKNTLIDNKYGDEVLKKQNNNIYNIAIKNFPNETIRIIDNETGQMEFISPSEFQQTYCDIKSLKEMKNDAIEDEHDKCEVCFECNII